MIELTDIALKQLKSIASEEKINDLCVRVKVIGGGCAGFSYDFCFEERANVTNFDEIFEQNDMTVCVDPLSFQYLDGITIDYIERDFGSGFKFINPNITSQCGCGSSFGV